jgi:hypothetical protein
MSADVSTRQTTRLRLQRAAKVGSVIGPEKQKIGERTQQVAEIKRGQFRALS